MASRSAKSKTNSSVMSKPHTPQPDRVELLLALLVIAAITIRLFDLQIFFFRNFWDVTVFYSLLILAIYHFRHKLDWQGKIVGMYRTKIGLKLMDRWGKHTFFWKTFGWLSIVFGFLGMILMTGMVIKAGFDFFLVPEAPPAIAPVIPGLPIPGLGISLPLITGWLALFVVIVIHEFSHGVVARAYKVPVDSSGVFFMGPLAGAFVEPNEKKLKKEKKSVQLAIFAAGPFSNIVTAVILFFAMAYLLIPAINGMVAPQGISFTEVYPGLPADKAGLHPGVTYLKLNNEPVGTNYQCSPEFERCVPYDFFVSMAAVKAGDILVFTDTTGNEYVMEAAPHPANESNGYIGVETGVVLSNPNNLTFYNFLWFILILGFWAYVLNLGIGLVNLLPMVITDGGRMFQIATQHFLGEKTGDTVWAKFGGILILLVLGLLLASVIKFWILPYL